MKSKLLKNTIIVLVVLLAVTALYFGIFVRKKIATVQDLNRQEKAMTIRKSELVELRLALIGIANSRVSDSDFYETLTTDMNRVEEGLKASEKQSLISEELLKEESEIQVMIEEIYFQVKENFSMYDNILEYDIAKDFSAPLNDEDYNDLLGRIISTVDGVKEYEEDEHLGEEAKLAVEELNSVKESMDIEDYTDLLSKLEIAVLNYNIMKIKAFNKVLEPIRSEDGVDMLVRLTSLIVSYENNISEISKEREELTSSIPASSGFFSILNVN